MSGLEGTVYTDQSRAPQPPQLIPATGHARKRDRGATSQASGALTNLQRALPFSHVVLLYYEGLKPRLASPFHPALPNTLCLCTKKSRSEGAQEGALYSCWTVLHTAVRGRKLLFSWYSIIRNYILQWFFDFTGP